MCVDVSKSTQIVFYFFYWFHFEYGRLFTMSDGSIENNPNGDFNYMKGLLVDLDLATSYKMEQLPTINKDGSKTTFNADGSATTLNTDGSVTTSPGGNA